jgi:hypothetical protein
MMSLGHLAGLAGLALFVTVLVAWFRQPRASQAIDRWHVVLPGVRVSTSASYRVLAERIRARKLAKVRVKQVALFESNPASFRRRYLRVRRENLQIFILCTAIDRRDQLISYWVLPKRSLVLTTLAHIPGLRWLAALIRAWRTFDLLPRGDAETHFREAIHRTVLHFAEELDPGNARLTQGHGPSVATTRKPRRGHGR